LAKDVAETIAAHVEANVLSACTATESAHWANASYFVVLCPFLFVTDNVIGS
jgi:hypothetical protein